MLIKDIVIPLNSYFLPILGLCVILSSHTQYVYCSLPPVIYYISAEGNDDWDGLSPSHQSGTTGPKRSLDAAQNLLNNQMQPGDQILFRKGDTWIDSAKTALLLNRVQGTKNEPIVIGAYGMGEYPIIKSNQPGGTVITIRSSNDGPTRWLIIKEIHATTDIDHDANAPLGIYLNDGIYEKPEHITLDSLVVEELSAGITNYSHHFTIQNSILRKNHNMGAVGPGAGYKQGLFTNGKNTIIRNNDFEYNGKYEDGFDHQIYVSNSDTVLIEANRFHNSTDGIKLRRGSNIIVRNNEFTDLKWSAIIAGGDTEGPQSNLTITGNYIHHISGGINLKSQSGTGGHGLHQVVIANNIFSTINSIDVGTHIMTIGPDIISNVLIANNVFYNPIGSLRNITINNANPTNIQIKNNIFHRKDTVQTQPWIVSAMVRVENNPTLQGITFDYNLYFAKKNGISLFLIRDASNTDVKYNTLTEFKSDFTIQEVNGQEGNPNWVSPVNENFHLTKSSLLAIDKGETLADVPHDRDGDTRPQGNGYDIGADELTEIKIINMSNLVTSVGLKLLVRNGKVHIQSKGVQKVTNLHLYSINGIFQKLAPIGSNCFSLPRVSSGIYIFQVQRNGQVFHHLWFNRD